MVPTRHNIQRCGIEMRLIEQFYQDPFHRPESEMNKNMAYDLKAASVFFDKFDVSYHQGRAHQDLETITP